MKVLHVWNTAGVGSVLAKYQRKVLGWHSFVITRKEYDRFGYLSSELGELVSGSKYVFVLKTLLTSTSYDIIHIHSFDKILPIFNIFRNLILFKNKKLIIHYHGSDIRNNWHKKINLYKYADIILVSTKDLLFGIPEKFRRKVIYLPNPVDTDFFKPLGLTRKERALLIVKQGRKHLWPIIKRIADELREKYGVDYDVLFIDDNPIPYIKMPLLLNKYKYFIDIPHGYYKYEKIINAISKTALEALACGTIVISHKFGIIKDLPDEHKPENVVKRLKDIIDMLT